MKLVSKAVLPVTDARRDNIKLKIDKIGRTKFATYIGENYYQLSKKLTGFKPLNEVYAYYYEGKITEMRGNK